MAVGVYIFALAGLTAARWAAAPLELSPPSNASSNSSSLASIEKPTSMVDPVPQLTPGSGEYTRPWQDAVVRSIESQGREDKQKAVSEMKQKESKKERSSDSSPSSASRSTKSDPKSSLPPDALHTGNESGESVPRGSLILPNEEDHQQANKTAEMPARNSEHEGGGIVQRAMTQLLETTSRLTAYYENKQDRRYVNGVLMISLFGSIVGICVAFYFLALMPVKPIPSGVVNENDTKDEDGQGESTGNVIAPLVESEDEDEKIMITSFSDISQIQQDYKATQRSPQYDFPTGDGKAKFTVVSNTIRRQNENSRTSEISAAEFFT